MTERRAMGALEAEVLAHLWASVDGQRPGDVLDALGPGLAYTTVMTILTRLWKKGLVDRERVGRAFVYRPRLSEADFTASRMRTHFERSGDREAVLSRFVGSLSRSEERMLRRILENRP